MMRKVVESGPVKGELIERYENRGPAKSSETWAGPRLKVNTNGVRGGRVPRRQEHYNEQRGMR